MKAVIVCLFVALAASGNAALPMQGRALLGGKKKNIAYAGVNVKSTGGSIYGRAESSSESVTVVKNAIAKSIAYAAGKVSGGESVAAVAYASAEAIATAIASAYVKTFAIVESDGEGNSGCAKAFASASAAASAYAEAYASAVAEVDSESSYSVAKAEVESIAVGTADAFAEAYSEACVVGKGRASAHQESLSVAIVEVYATAVAKALAGIKDGKATSKAHGEAKSKIKDEHLFTETFGGIDVESHGGHATGHSTGAAEAATNLIYPCPPVFSYCCPRRHHNPYRRFGRYRSQRKPRFDETCNCGYKCQMTYKNHDGDYENVYELGRDYLGYPEGFKCYCSW